MAKRGRPVTWTEEKLDDLANRCIKYTEETEIPILAEFCYENGILREQIYELAKKSDILSYAIKSIMNKKQTQLEKKALNGEINTTMAVFSLKQMGWSDKVEQKNEISGKNGEPLGIQVSFKKCERKK